jgi:[ribosomal protein S18]-alanine N-acetyltransferase
VYNLAVLDAWLLYALTLGLPRQIMPFLLAPLTESCLNEAVELDQQVLGGFWSAQSYREELTRPNSDLVGLWSTASPTEQDLPLLAMGCAWRILDEAHIILMAVHPKYRRCGLGYGILLKLLDAAHGCGMKYATLEVRASNVAAIALYTKLGFATAGTRRNYYSDTGEDALVMWRSGLQTAEFSEQMALHWGIVQQRWQQYSGK